MSITDIEIVHCKVRPKFKDLESVVCNFLINVVNVIGKIIFVAKCIPCKDVSCLKLGKITFNQNCFSLKSFFAFFSAAPIHSGKSRNLVEVVEEPPLTASDKASNPNSVLDEIVDFTFARKR